jgi:hypothetical protein
MVQRLVKDIDGAIVPATESRRFFTTDRGTVGIGPKSMVTGDKIFMLGGSLVLFVTRGISIYNLSFKTPQYELIGDCYLHGVMDGKMATAAHNYK